VLALQFSTLFLVDLPIRVSSLSSNTVLEDGERHKVELTTLLQLYLHLQTIRLSNPTRSMGCYGVKEGSNTIKVVEIIRPPVVGVWSLRGW
jgi:hypothetical protein